MADKGPGPKDLIRLRIETEIMRLRATKMQQELEIAETLERVSRLKDNITATEKEISKQNDNLEALLKGEGGDN